MSSTTIQARIFSVLSLTTLVSFGMAACGGGGNKQVATPATTGANAGAASGASGDNACKSKESCPPVEADISATFAPSGALIGFVGEAVNWEFYGVDTKSMSADSQSSSRKVMVLLDKIPAEAQIVPGKGEKLDTHARVDWTPAKVYTGKTMSVILRDYDRCVVNLSEEECNSYSLKGDYDKQQEVRWEIADRDQLQAQVAAGGQPGATGNVVNVANPNCGPAPTTKGQITSSLFTTGLGVLMNPQAAMPGLLSQMMQGGLGGGGAAGGQPPPTQC